MNEPLREEEIRPERLKKEQLERFAADIQRLLGRRSEFQNVPCPACASSSQRHAFRKYELDYLACTECATVYVSPRPTPAVLEYYYSTSENYQYWNKHVFPASEGARRAKIFRPRAERLLDICRRHGVATDTLLEVGAGFGTFCEEVGRTGLFRRVIAVEPTPDLAATCRGRGLEVSNKPIENVSLEAGSVNVIASFEVIEHLYSPRSFIESCARVLAPGGLLVLSCPNVKGFDAVVLGPVSDTFDVEHLNYFHPASLAHLLGECGLEVIESLTPGKLDAELVRKKVLGGEASLAGQPFLERLLLEEWDRVGTAFQSFLADHGLSSHMWLVARKG
jgi:2-polyprenyl-3-methyl-5-hydroxy-6-metoxy-1,4-benzoquinol methylase